MIRRARRRSEWKRETVTQSSAEYLLGLLEQTAELQTKLVKTGVGFHPCVLAVPPLRFHRARRTLVAERALQVAIKMSSSRGRKRGTPPTSPSRAVKIPASAAAAASAPPPGARGGAGQLPDDAPEPAAPHGGSGSSNSCAAARPQRAKKAREIMGSAPRRTCAGRLKPQAFRFAAALLASTKNGTLVEICTLFDISPQSTNYYTKKFKNGEKYSELRCKRRRTCTQTPPPPPPPPPTPPTPPTPPPPRAAGSREGCCCCCTEGCKRGGAEGEKGS